jgi:uncharacterized protein YjbI with pentapeptide repeats
MAGDQTIPWDTCSHQDCIGVRVGRFAWCLAHLAVQEPSTFEEVLRGIGAEGAIDARGVQLSAELLTRILDSAPRRDGHLALSMARFDQSIIPDANFGGAIFQGEAGFSDATFLGVAGFNQVVFQHDAWFSRATFQEGAWFNGVSFQHDAWFGGATSWGDAEFYEATFQGLAQFSGVTVQRGAGFRRAVFRGEAWFQHATFWREASFEDTVFDRARQIGPMMARQLVFDDVVFTERVRIDVAAAALCARRAKFSAGVQFRLRWASVVLDDADLAAPAILAGQPDPFPQLDEQDAASRWERLPPGPREQRWRPRLLSLRRADIAGLRVANVDLRACRFSGTHNLDRLRIEGETLFARTHGWWRARRKTLAQEQQWRASRSGRWRPGGWYPQACQPPAYPNLPPPPTLAPVQLAALYRELRKGLEDNKNEPGAADFYYGEMEMRRHDRRTPRAERGILWLYWLVAGYGLRGLRSLASLAAVVVGLAALLHVVGFAARPSPSSFWGSLLYAASSTLSIGDEQVQLTGWGKLLRITLRLAGPLLLGLMLLSIRNRVKR